MGKALIQKHKVEFCECDMFKNVHNSKIFVWFERARFEIAKRVKLTEMQGIDGEDGYYFPVVEAECEFLEPITIGMNTIIKTELERPDVAKLKFNHVIENRKTGAILVKAYTVVSVCSRRKGLLLNLTEEMQRLIDKYLDE